MIVEIRDSTPCAKRRGGNLSISKLNSPDWSHLRLKQSICVKNWAIRRVQVENLQLTEAFVLSGICCERFLRAIDVIRRPSGSSDLSKSTAVSVLGVWLYKYDKCRRFFFSAEKKSLTEIKVSLSFPLLSYATVFVSWKNWKKGSVY